MLGLVTGEAFLGYYVLLWVEMVFARNGTVPPFVAAWIPNVTFVGVSVAVPVSFADRARPRRCNTGTNPIASN
jgi:lipopolysaccharide export LptBFGC system permease protein LptF